MEKTYSNIFLYSMLILVSFFTGCFFFSGSFIPSSIPFAYGGGDELFHLQRIKMVVENSWVYLTNDLGWPFGANFLDYPMPDTAHYLLHKLLFFFFGNIWAVYNTHFLLGFPLVAIFSFWVFRQFSISTPLAFAGALIYTNLPFHYLRYAHLFYTWYFVAPLFTWYSWKIFAKEPLFFEATSGWLSRIFHAVVLIILASFGVYYTFFGIMMMVTSGSIASLKYRNYKQLTSALLASGIMVITILVTVIPNLMHRNIYDKNPEVANRSFVASEIFGLKIAPLLLPRLGHRFAPFNIASSNYYSATQVTHTNENMTSNLGIIGSLGFIALLVIILLNIEKKQKLPVLHFLSRLNIVSVLFTTVAGFAVLFSMFVMSEIRSWNRICVFIAFFSITASLTLLQHFLLNRVNVFQHHPSMQWLLSTLLIIFALWDQTTPPCKNCIENSRQAFYSDAKFINEIENSLLPGSAIYQLPYNGFPEMGPVNAMPPYSLLTGYLHSSKLRWSYGGIQGRKGDLFFRALAQEPIAKQIEVIKNLDFSGVYIDRRGYVDYGKALETEFTKLLGPPLIVSDNQQLVFFALGKK